MIKVDTSSPLIKHGLRIVKVLHTDGFKAFWVGGTVRDLILNREIDNLDIATSAKPEQVVFALNKIGIKHKDIGARYGTILAVTNNGPIEITTFRTEGEYINRRKPKEVKYVEDYRIDSMRRDLTINALYFDPVTKELLDPQNGLQDINRKLIKFVGNPKKRIDEDALRLIRAVRFSTQLEFKIEKNSFAAIKTRAKYIASISGERVRQELEKILIDPNRINGIKELDSTGLLKFIMPEISVLKTIHHKSKHYHLEGSVFEHVLLVLKNIKFGSLPLAYAALYHDAGKATTATSRSKPEGIVNSFPGHEYVSADLFKNLSIRLKISRKDTEQVLWITQMHMKRIAFIKDMDITKKIELVTHKYFSNLLELWKADSQSNLLNINNTLMYGEPLAYKEGVKLFKKIQSNTNLIDKLTNGELLMKLTNNKPGPHIKKLKLVVIEKVVQNKIKNLSTLKKFLNNYTKNT